MNNITKKTAFGITTAAAATVLVAGFAAPAMASTSHEVSRSETSSTSTVTHAQLAALRSVTTGLTGGDVNNSSPVVIAPEIGGGSLNIGDVASGNAIGSGNDAPLLSGNDTSAPLLSGNDTALANNNGNGSGNGNASGNSASANGNSASADGNSASNSVSGTVKDLVNSVTKATTGSTKAGNGSSTSAKDIVGNITDDLDLGSILGD